MKKWEIMHDDEGYIFVVEKLPKVTGVAPGDFDYEDCFTICQVHPRLDEVSDIWGTPGPEWYARALAASPRMMSLLKEAKRNSLDHKFIAKVEALLKEIDGGEMVTDD